jgi:hypothetical protein
LQGPIDAGRTRPREWCPGPIMLALLAALQSI